MNDSLKTKLIVIAIISVFVFAILWRFNLIKIKPTGQKKAEKEAAKLKAELAAKKQVDKTKKEEIDTTINTSDLLKPNTWTTAPKGTKLLTDAEARKKAGSLYYAMYNVLTKLRKLNTDESAISSVFRSLNSPYQVSQLAFSYAANSGGHDLAYDLEDALTDNELLGVYEIIEKL
jgi:hypothetical protein